MYDTLQVKEKVKEKQDCKVGEWGQWGECSKTCDIGEFDLPSLVV